MPEYATLNWYTFCGWMLDASCKWNNSSLTHSSASTTSTLLPVWPSVDISNNSHKLTFIDLTWSSRKSVDAFTENETVTLPTKLNIDRFGWINSWYDNGWTVFGSRMEVHGNGFPLVDRKGSTVLFLSPDSFRAVVANIWTHCGLDECANAAMAAIATITQTTADMNMMACLRVQTSCWHRCRLFGVYIALFPPSCIPGNYTQKQSTYENFTQGWF